MECRNFSSLTDRIHQNKYLNRDDKLLNNSAELCNVCQVKLEITGMRIGK